MPFQEEQQASIPFPDLRQHFRSQTGSQSIRQFHRFQGIIGRVPKDFASGPYHVGFQYLVRGTPSLPPQLGHCTSLASMGREQCGARETWLARRRRERGRLVVLLLCRGKVGQSRGWWLLLVEEVEGGGGNYFPRTQTRDPTQHARRVVSLLWLLVQGEGLGEEGRVVGREEDGHGTPGKRALHYPLPWSGGQSRGRGRGGEPGGGHERAPERLITERSILPSDSDALRWTGRPCRCWRLQRL